MVANEKVFSRITCVFDTIKPPRSGPSETALHLLKESPGRGPAARRNFSELQVKINDFFMEITLFYYFVIIKNIFQKYVGSHRNGS